jgi:hypothetical protein
VAEFYLDHNVALELAEHLRRAGHGAQTARQRGLERAGDEAHLWLAAHSGWALITHNAKDFTLLHAAWKQWSKGWGVDSHHAGILLLTPPISPELASREIVGLVQAEMELSDKVYTWRGTIGWVRQS